MKTLFSITISLLCAITIVNAQSCLPEGITFSSQQQIDDFQTNYPGCTEIAGYVKIDEAAAGDITSLYGLNNITSIGGYLRIFSNAALENLNGLYNLTSIGGYLKILANDNLYGIGGLQSLTFIGDELTISGNDLLEDLDGLDQLTSIGGYLRIAYSDALTDIHGIEHIFHEGIESNDPDIDDLVIIYNPLLSHCAMDNICVLVNDGFTTTEIHDNAEGCNSQGELENACVNSCLSSGIEFTTQQQIDNFPINYPSCSEIGGDVTITESNAGDITNLNGLSQIALVKGQLDFFDNTALTDLQGLEGLQSIEKDLRIVRNSSLISLQGLDNLNSAGKYEVTIGENPSLVSLAGLEEVSLITGDLNIYDNPSLVSVEGLVNLTRIEDGDLWIGSNDALENLEGLEALTSVGFILDISGNYNLISLTGLENLQTAGNSILLIVNNANLHDLTGLENIQTLQDIYITQNSSLTSLTGLEGLTDVGNFQCYENSSLAYCATESICALIENLSPNIFSLGVNALGCNSIVEIEQACQSTCLESGITFTSQQEIDDFAASYANCSTVMGDVIIDETIIGDIIDLSALSHLTTIEGGLQISGNFSLNNLSGLDNLTTINGSLEVFGNAALSNIEALRNIDPNTINTSSDDDIEIYSNPQLSQCALENICDALQQVGTTSNIHNNAVGCNTVEEVEAACLLNPTTNINELEMGIHLYPNPVSDVLIVELKDHLVNTQNVRMAIYSSLGTAISFESNPIDTHKTSLKLAASTPAGIYLLKITDGPSQFTSTFVFTP